MAAMLFRVALLAVGLGAAEIAIGPALAGSVVGWAGLLLGLGLITAGSAGFMGPLLSGSRGGMDRNA